MTLTLPAIEGKFRLPIVLVCDLSESKVPDDGTLFEDYRWDNRPEVSRLRRVHPESVQKPTQLAGPSDSGQKVTLIKEGQVISRLNGIDGRRGKSELPFVLWRVVIEPSSPSETRRMHVVMLLGPSAPLGYDRLCPPGEMYRYFGLMRMHVSTLAMFPALAKCAADEGLIFVPQGDGQTLTLTDPRRPIGTVDPASFAIRPSDQPVRLSTVEKDGPNGIPSDKGNA